jgi:AcrR family transcriptional regulator
MKSSHRKSVPREEKREAILQSAWALIRQRGYHKTTVDEIASGARVAKGTVYLYFASKAEIMLAIVDKTNSRIAEGQDRIAAAPGISAEDRLRGVIKHRLMTLFDIIHRYPFGEEMVTYLLPHIVHRLETYVERHGSLIGRIIAEGRAAGDFRSDDPEADGQMLAKLFEHLTPPYYRFDSRRSLDLFSNQLLELLMVGLRRAG